MTGGDEGGQVLQPVGVRAEHDRAEHLRAGRDQDDQQRPRPVLRGSARRRRRAGRPGRAAEQQLLAQRGEVIEGQEAGDHARTIAAKGSGADIGWLAALLPIDTARPVVAWTNGDCIIPSPALSNERLRAVIERPVFIVAPPRSGGSALFRSLARAPGVFSAQGPVLDGIFELEPGNREWDSNWLTGADVEARAVEELRGRLKGVLADSAGNWPGLDPSFGGQGTVRTSGSGMPRSAPAGTFPRRVTSLGGDLRAWKPRFGPGIRHWLAAFGCAVVALLVISPAAKAGSERAVPCDRRQARRHPPRRLPECPAHHLLLPPSRYPGPEHHPVPTGDRWRAKALAPGGRLHHSLRSRVDLRRRNGPSGSTFCTCTTPSGRSTATLSSRSVRRRRSSSCPRGSVGRTMAPSRPIPTPGSSTTCCTTSSRRTPRSSSSGGSTSFRRDLDVPAIKPGAHQVVGCGREPEHSIRSSTRCDRTARTVATRSPIRRRRGPTSIRAARAVGLRTPTVVSGPPEQVDAEPGRDPDRHRRAPAPRRSRHAATGHPCRPDLTPSSRPRPTITSRQERSHGTSRWVRRRLPGGCS